MYATRPTAVAFPEADLAASAAPDAFLSGCVSRAARRDAAEAPSRVSGFEPPTSS